MARTDIQMLMGTNPGRTTVNPAPSAVVPPSPAIQAPSPKPGYTDKEVKFLKALKTQGVPMEEAFNRLRAVKAASPEKVAAPLEKPTFGDTFKKGLVEMAQPIIGAGKGILKSAETLGRAGSMLGGDMGAFKKPSFIPENLKTPSNAGQKIGFEAEKLGEFFVPGAVGMKASKGAGLLARMAEGGLSNYGVTSFQTEKPLGKDALISGGIGVAMPLATAVVSKAAKFLTGGVKGLINNTTGLTSAQMASMNRIATAENSATGKPVYDSAQDFLVKKGILGKGLEAPGRNEIVEKGESLLSSTMADKAKLIKDIPSKVKNEFGKVISLLHGKVTALNGTNAGALDDEVKFLNGVLNKKTLDASQIDKLRSIADDLIFSERDALVSNKLKDLISPLRQTLGKMDKTGTLKMLNTDIMLLQKLVGKGQLLQKAAEKPIGSTLTGMGAMGSFAIPGVGPILGTALVAKAASKVPQIAGPTARTVLSLTERGAPDFARKAISAVASRTLVNSGKKPSARAGLNGLGR